MSRPFKCRRICEEPKFNSFAPLGVENAEKCMISVDEYEAVRLIDLEKRPISSVLNLWEFQELRLQICMKRHVLKLLTVLLMEKYYVSQEETIGFAKVR